jgi:hypothetical protein
MTGPPARTDREDAWIRDTDAGPDLVLKDASGNLWTTSCTLNDLWRIEELIRDYRCQVTGVDAWWTADDGTIIYSVRTRGGSAYATAERPALPNEAFPRREELEALWKAAAEHA